jgi:hypothetical protein
VTLLGVFVGIAIGFTIGLALEAYWARVAKQAMAVDAAEREAALKADYDSALAEVVALRQPRPKKGRGRATT